jgi:cation:H+ antiporter
MTIAILLICGAALLVAGAELLVRGAARIAAAAGISPLVIGLTVVAFGTSAPELAVSLGATFAGEPDIAVGNAVGSNIFNVLFILGVSALIVPLAVQQQVVRFELPIMLAVSVALLLVALDGSIGRVDGALLFAGLIGYLVYLARQGGVAVVPELVDIDVRGDAAAGAGLNAQSAIDDPGATRSARGLSTTLASAFLALFGLVLLVAGSRFFVNGAVALATMLGVSQAVIGLTIIATGTSLPELATSVLAGIRGERDIAVGNVVGSNIFNILGILGLCGLLGADALSIDVTMLRFDIPVMVAVAVITLPILFTGYRISRLEGVLFLGYYVAYTAFLILKTTEHDSLESFSGVMLLFILPLTVIGLAVSVIVARRAARSTGFSRSGT